jgi:hypothetical protein
MKRRRGSEKSMRPEVALSGVDDEVVVVEDNIVSTGEFDVGQMQEKEAFLSGT